MEKRFAQIISVIFHPVLVPTYGILLLLNLNAYFTFRIPLQAKIMLVFMMLTSTVIIPLILFIILKHRKIIADLFMNTKEERVYPYLSFVVIYFLLYYLVSNTALHPIFSYFLLATTLLALVFFFINLWWKISAHTGGMSALISMIIILSLKMKIDLYPIIATIILLSGLVGFARLKTNSHKPSEVYLGYLLGAIVFTGMFLLI
jgi:hypothetical protein